MTNTTANQTGAVMNTTANQTGVMTNTTEDTTMKRTASAMTKTMKWVNTIAFALMVVVNALANILPLGIGQTGAVSGKYPNLFTPAPITFAIWGVIYLGMGAFILYQWGLFDKNGQSQEVAGKIGPWFTISALFNIGWIFAWHYDVIWLSVILIAGLLLSLIVITRKLRKETLTPAGKLSASIPFGIYFGWIIAATIANISVFLTKLGWTGFGLSATVWTMLILTVGALIASANILFDNRIVPALAVVWAYVGILIKHISTDGYAGSYPLVIAAAVFGIVIIAVAMAFNKIRLSDLSRVNAFFDKKRNVKSATSEKAETPQVK